MTVGAVDVNKAERDRLRRKGAMKAKRQKRAGARAKQQEEKPATTAAETACPEGAHGAGHESPGAETPSPE